ncbi:HK97 family phage prohead protease [Candidatus Pyrohabitans sp.]
MMKTKSLVQDIQVIDEEKRIAKGWASVEIVDLEGDVISIDAFKKIMDVYLKRGGPILDEHTHKHVGKTLSYEFKEKNGRPGVLLTFQIFKDYSIDDQVWEEIKSGKKRGLSVGFKPLEQVQKCTPEMCRNEIKEIELFEVSVVQMPANPEATIEAVASAKSLAAPCGKKLCLVKLHEQLKELMKGDPEFHRCVQHLREQYGEDGQYNPWAVCHAALSMSKDMTWDECIEQARKDPDIDDPERFCGWLYWHGPNAEQHRRERRQRKKDCGHASSHGEAATTTSKGGTDMGDQENKAAPPAGEEAATKQEETAPAVNPLEEILARLERIEKRLAALESAGSAEEEGTEEGKSVAEDLEAKIEEVVEKAIKKHLVPAASTPEPEVDATPAVEKTKGMPDSLAAFVLGR